jgi:hypothetical protein
MTLSNLLSHIGSSRKPRISIVNHGSVPNRTGKEITENSVVITKPR